MTYRTPIFASFCLLVGACSGTSTSADDTTTPVAGAGASAAGATNGGDTSVGGSTAQGAGAASGFGASAGTGAGDAGGSSSAGSEAGGSSPAGGGDAGGSSPAGGSAGAGQAGGSGFAIDYSIWQLQLPTGSGNSPTIVPPSKLAAESNIYFHQSTTDGGWIFMDPPTGITTNGSIHPRTELRESKPDNSEPLWSASAINTLTVTGKAIKCDSCTIGQVFNGPDSITLAELQYSSSNGGSLKVFYEEAKSMGLPLVDLGVSVPLDTQYTYIMSFSKNVLTVSVNGKVRYTHNPSASILASKFYFKVGDYDQKATAGAVSTAVNSQIENYSIVVSHQ